MKDFRGLEAGDLFPQFYSYLLHLKTSASVDLQNSLIPAYLALGIILSLLFFIIRRILLIKRSLNELSVLLELTPPAITEKTAYTTQQLFSVIHDLGKTKSFKDKLFGKKTVFSFEISSTQNQGIRYLIRTTPSEVSNVKRSLLSYLPHISVKTVNEYLPQNAGKLKNFNTKIIEFKLKRHFAYSLQRQDTLEEHDPVAYITGAMTKLSPGELISFQIVLSPTTRGETGTLSKMILNNENVLGYLNRFQFPLIFAPVTILFKIISKILNVLGSQIQWALTELTSGGNIRSTYAYHTDYQSQLRQAQFRPARILSSFEQLAVQSIQGKIDQPLFESSVRLLIIVKDKNELKERIKGFTSSLAIFAVPKYQSLNKKYNFPPVIADKVRLLNFKKRLLSLIFNNSPSILSVSEVADLYHFPFSRVTRTENIVKVYSKELPAPLSLKKENSPDVVFGKNNYGGTATDIGLTKEERVRHMYIIGATGTGKTTMILKMADQDIKNGKGVAVIDPHGDLAESLLSCIPDKRKDDLIYFNPDDIKYPIGVNLLELTPGLNEDDQLREKELITESIISLFRKIFSEVWSAHAHRLEYTLRNTIQTALTLEDPTLFTIYELLTNPDFQKKVTPYLKDEHLKNFWKHEFGKAGDFQKVKMIGPITSRVGRFLFSPSAKRILEQKRSTINFDKILDNGKILICNLSKGKLGEDTSEVLGIMILTKIQLAALKRARTEAKNRTPFYLYVDEFQNFATPSFIQMLSEARKYGINLVMAEQSTSQQKDRNLVNVVLANVGTVISFRSANPDDEKLMLPQFRPYVEQGEIANLPSFKFYIKIAAINPEESFSGETVPVSIKVDKKKVEELIKSSRDNFAIVYRAPEVVKKPDENTGEEDNNYGKNEDEYGSVGTLT